MFIIVIDGSDRGWGKNVFKEIIKREFVYLTEKMNFYIRDF